MAIETIDVEEIIRNINREYKPNSQSFSQQRHLFKSIVEGMYQIDLSDAIINFCIDNFKEVSTSVPPILADIINRHADRLIGKVRKLEGDKMLRITRPQGLYNLVNGINGDGVKIEVEGLVGGYFCAYSTDIDIVVKGGVGRFGFDNSYCGNNHLSRVLVYGNCDEGLGEFNHGINYLVVGKTFTRTFPCARSGTLIVTDGIGEYSGMFMEDGVIIALSGADFKNIGSGMKGGAIFMPKDSLCRDTLGEGTELIGGLSDKDFKQIQDIFNIHKREGINITEKRGYPALEVLTDNGKITYGSEGLIKIVSRTL